MFQNDNIFKLVMKEHENELRTSQISTSSISPPNSLYFDLD
jgi:hypothetical protein